jgi:hypothetical protein
MTTSKMRALTFNLVIATAAVVGLAAPAFAQESTPPPSAPVPEVKRTGRMAGDVGSGGLGVGGTVFLSGLTGPEVVYDFGLWHLSGLVAFRSVPNAFGNRGTDFAFGVGGWYHLHIGENSDFSVGGNFGLETISPGSTPMNNNPPGATGFEFEPGVQVRAFITPNVALHGGAGIVLAFGDNVGGGGSGLGVGPVGVGALDKQISLTAGFTGDFGFTYYFR